MASKKIASKKSSPRTTKAAFIRSLPGNLSAKEVVARGKDAGYKFGEAYVYSVRTASQARAVKKANEKAAPALPPVYQEAAVTAGLPSKPGITKAKPSTADVLRAAAAEMGLAKAIELLTNDRALLARITGTES